MQRSRRVSSVELTFRPMASCAQIVLVSGSYISMWLSCHANVRVTSAAKRSYAEALVLCFRSGAFSAGLCMLRTVFLNPDGHSLTLRAFVAFTLSAGDYFVCLGSHDVVCVAE